MKWRRRGYKQAQKRGIESFKKGEMMVKTRPDVVRRVPRDKRVAGDPIFFLLAAAWVDPGRSALQSAEQWCKGRYGRIHQVGKMSFYDKNMRKGRLKQHTNQKRESETGNHPRKVPGLQKRAPVMSERQPLCRRRNNNIAKKMALVKPRGSTYARASVQVTREWRI